MRASVINMASSTLGAGVLSLPYAVSQAGVGLSVLTLGGLLYFALSSIHIIVQCIEVTDRQSFEELAVVTWGRRFGILVEVGFFHLGQAIWDIGGGGAPHIRARKDEPSSERKHDLRFSFTLERETI